MKELLIGDIARKFALNPKTIRYYESIGLLPKAKRTESGYRLYDKVSVEKLEFIIRAKSLGLTLDEIKKILQLHDSGEVPCECTRQFIKNKIRDTEEKIAALNNLNTKLRKLLRLERDKTAKSICPIITGESKKA
jgi:DNA-binding transcriptional MerR regulator